MLTRSKRLHRIIASEGGLRLETGDCCSPWWNFYSLARPSAASRISISLVKLYACTTSVTDNLPLDGKRTKVTLFCY